MEFKKERNAALLQAYNQVLKSYSADDTSITRREIIGETVHQETPQFYVTYEEARRNVRRIITGKPYKCRNRYKRMMYNEIAERVSRLMSQRPVIPFNDLLFEVIDRQCAPRFYMSEDAAQILIYDLLRGGER